MKYLVEGRKSMDAKRPDWRTIKYYKQKPAAFKRAKKESESEKFVETNIVTLDEDGEQIAHSFFKNGIEEKML